MESAPPVLIGERVAWLGSGSGLPRAGLVRWIGKLPEIGPGWTLGLELDNALPVGGIDGDWGGRKLFNCKERHGLLVPVGQTAREKDVMKWRTRHTSSTSDKKLQKTSNRSSSATQQSQLLQQLFKNHELSKHYPPSSHQNALSAIGNDLFPPVAATRRKHQQYLPPLKPFRQQQLLEQHQQFLERLKKIEETNSAEENYQWFDCQSSFNDESKNIGKKTITNEATPIKSHAMNEDHPDLELQSSSQNGFFSFFKWFRPRKDTSTASTPEDTPPQIRRRRRSSCASLDTLLSTATAHSFAFVPPSQYRPTSLGRRKRPAPSPPGTATQSLTTRHRRSASESFKDKRSGAYLHVKGKRRAPQPPSSATNSLDRIKPSPFSSLRRKKRVAPQPPADCKLTTEQREKLIENISILQSQDIQFPNDILKLEGGVLIQTTKEMPREITSTIVGTSATSTATTTTAPVSPRPWYKRRKDKSLEKQKKEDNDGGRFSLLFSEKRKEEKRKSQLSILANISELDRQAAAIVQKEQAREQAALEAHDAKFYEQVPDSPALAKASANREFELENVGVEVPKRSSARELISLFNAIGNVTRVTVNSAFQSTSSNFFEKRFSFIHSKDKDSPNSSCEMKLDENEEKELDIVTGTTHQPTAPTNASSKAKVIFEANRSRRKNSPDPDIPPIVEISESSTPASTLPSGSNPPSVTPTAPPAPGEFWTCPRCTLANEKWKIMCEACKRWRPTNVTYQESIMSSDNNNILMNENKDHIDWENELKKYFPKERKTESILELPSSFINKTAININKNINNNNSNNNNNNDHNNTINIITPSHENSSKQKIGDLMKKSSNEPHISEINQHIESPSTSTHSITNNEKQNDITKNDHHQNSITNESKRKKEYKIPPPSTFIGGRLKQDEEKLPKENKKENEKVNQFMNYDEEKEKMNVEELRKARLLFFNKQETDNKSEQLDRNVKIKEQLKIIENFVELEDEENNINNKFRKDNKDLKMNSTNGPKDENERAKLRAMIRQIKDSLPKKQSQYEDSDQKTDSCKIYRRNDADKGTYQPMRMGEFKTIEAFRRPHVYANVEQGDEDRLMKQLIKPDGIASFKESLLHDEQTTNTLAVNRLLRRLEAAIAGGQHQQAALLARDLAQLKISCSVTRQRRSLDNGPAAITVELFVEDRVSHQGPLPLQVRSSWTLAELKTAVEKELEIPVKVQRWILGRQLATDDEKTLINHGIATDGAPIFLYIVTPDGELENNLIPLGNETNETSKNKTNSLENLNLPSTSDNKKKRPSPPPDRIGGTWYYNSDEERYSFCEDTEPEITDDEFDEDNDKHNANRKSSYHDDGNEAGDEQTETELSEDEEEKTTGLIAIVHEHPPIYYHQPPLKELIQNNKENKLIQKQNNNDNKKQLQQQQNVIKKPSLPQKEDAGIQVEIYKPKPFNGAIPKQFSNNEKEKRPIDDIIKKSPSKENIPALKRISKPDEKSPSINSLEINIKNKDSKNPPNENGKFVSSVLSNSTSSRNLEESPSNALNRGAIPKQIRIYPTVSLNGATSNAQIEKDIKITYIGRKMKEIENDLVAVHKQMNGNMKLEETKDNKTLITNGVNDNKAYDENVIKILNKKDQEEVIDKKKLEEKIPPIKPLRMKNKTDTLESNPTGTLKLGWCCTRCTLVNPPTRPGCRACAGDRPSNYQPPTEYKASIQEKLRLDKEKQDLKNKEDAIHYRELVDLDKTDLVISAEPFECPVCLVEYSSPEGVVLRDCLHTFCRSCLANTIQFCDDAEVKCPFRDENYACDSSLQEREIKALVPANIYEEHLAKSVAEAEHRMNNAFHCKTPDCRGWCIFEDNVNLFKCPVCTRTNCLTCQAIHEGIDCKIYQHRVAAASETNADARRTKQMLDEMVQRGEAMVCPSCQVVLMKKWGCDWLRCSMCKTEICWVTRGPRWGPGGKGDTTGGCKCGVNGNKCHPRCNYCH